MCCLAIRNKLKSMNFLVGLCEDVGNIKVHLYYSESDVASDGFIDDQIESQHWAAKKIKENFAFAPI